MIVKSLKVVFSIVFMALTSMMATGTTFVVPEIFSSKGPLPISLAEAPKLFKQCSRIAPKPVGPYWLPSFSVIAKLEGQLTEHLIQAGFERWSDPRWHSGPYRGQYVGFMQERKKLIYASYSREYVEDHVNGGQAIIMCDGGPSLWGIVYNLEKEEFFDLQTNGR
ncbi:hypothetical protein GCM10007094_06340 [Pseudovibrio japonicus]|uniref:Uncharacterized protein n=1 Tax=Pseudovibrio japonicus TaxID=366534 RepID=A0ABQ3E250_9HYPH|nr:hypothetical protein [Pseudovibrio japonicus]GHB21000.1 hypothetical protein GCM10007094_06340 [Pseudovibrio japonicus]